jgi:hypothetical protein
VSTMFPVTIALIDEWVIAHKWSTYWASVSIPHSDTADATVYQVTDDGQTIVDTLPNSTARDTVQHCADRPNEYHVYRQI